MDTGMAPCASLPLMGFEPVQRTNLSGGEI
jgi:hypothetical protein